MSRASCSGSRCGSVQNVRMIEEEIGARKATVELRKTTCMKNHKGRNPMWLRPLCVMGATGFEPVTPSVSSRGLTPTDNTTEPHIDKGVEDRPTAASIPSVCTQSFSKLAAGDIAEAIRGLPEAERLKLVAYLLTRQ